MNKLIAISIFSVSLLGCSNQWREMDVEFSSQEVLSMLGEVQTGSSFGGTQMSEVLAMKDEPGTAIYFAEASAANPNGPMGSVHSVISLTNFSFMGMPELIRNMIEETRIFFLDQLTGGGGHRAGLIIGIKKGGEGTFSYNAFVGTGSISDEELSITMQGGSGSIIVRSMDLDGDDLMGIIQLKVWDLSAGESYIGKFSTLAGFSD